MYVVVYNGARKTFTSSTLSDFPALPIVISHDYDEKLSNLSRRKNLETERRPYNGAVLLSDLQENNTVRQFENKPVYWALMAHACVPSFLQG
jgi:hypothetical protein